MREFKKGDRVRRINRDYMGMRCGDTGVVINNRYEDGFYLVQVDKDGEKHWHNKWNLELVDEASEPKFRVGDPVTIIDDGGHFEISDKTLRDHYLGRRCRIGTYSGKMPRISSSTLPVTGTAGWHAHFRIECILPIPDWDEPPQFHAEIAGNGAWLVKSRSNGLVTTFWDVHPDPEKHAKAEAERLNNEKS